MEALTQKAEAMKRIYKYPLAITGLQSVPLPVGAEILTVQMQGDSLCLWALVDAKVVSVTRRTFEVFGTGHDMDTNPRTYLGTVQQAGGALVWHVFERRP